MNQCTRAIIPVAGYGGRRLPITKSIEKCMLPILNRPIVDYVVQDCIRAGIKDIYLVVGKESNQVREYYGRNLDFEDYLRRNGKHDALESIMPPVGVTFHFVEQDQTGAYGTAVPVALCRDFIPAGESAVVCMGDDCLYYPDDHSSDVARLMSECGESAGMIGVEVDPADVSSYGVIELDDTHHFVRIVEKPTSNEAPSNLINVSKYLFTSDLLDVTKQYVNEEADPSGEYFITEPINTYVSQSNPLRVIAAKGEYLDAGTLKGWLKANDVVAAHELG